MKRISFDLDDAEHAAFCSACRKVRETQVGVLRRLVREFTRAHKVIPGTAGSGGGSTAAERTLPMFTLYDNLKDTKLIEDMGFPSSTGVVDKDE